MREPKEETGDSDVVEDKEEDLLCDDFTGRSGNAADAAEDNSDDDSTDDE